MKLALFLLAVTATAQVPDCSVAPGYLQEGPAREFTTDTLFEYMDGNSEGYFAYGFVRMRGVTCSKGEDKLILDISEMADSEYAYGMFTSTRDNSKPVEPLGMGGQVAPRKAIFSKGKYYVEAAAEPEKDHSAVLAVVARALERKTPGETKPPESLTWFSPENLAAPVKLVPQSVLGLRILKKGYVAQYPAGKAFLLSEASPEDAAAVMTKLRERLGLSDRAGVAEESYRGEDRYLGKLCVFRKGRFVGGYTNVADGQDAVALASALAARVR